MAVDLSTPNALSLTGGTIDYTNPDWYNTYMQNVAGAGNTLTGNAQQPGSVASNLANWNIDSATGQKNPLTGDFNTNLMGGFDAAKNATGPNGYLTQASNQVNTASTYDPAKMQTFMNPYVNDAATATTNMSNKNLFESILPQVNSTFTGAGQFGSTRNADFENRAIRDQQRTLTDSLGTLNYGAQTNAAAQYSDWANKGMTAGMNTDKFGQENIQNLNTTGKGYLDWQNQGYQTAYQDFQNQLKYPLDAMGALSQATGSLKGSTTPSQQVTPGEMSGAQKAAILTQMIGQLGSDSTTDDLQALWDRVFNASNP